MSTYKVELSSFVSHNYLLNEDLRDQRPRSIVSDRWLLSDQSIGALDGDTLFAALQIIPKNMRYCKETNKQINKCIIIDVGKA